MRLKYMAAPNGVGSQGRGAVSVGHPVDVAHAGLWGRESSNGASSQTGGTGTATGGCSSGSPVADGSTQWRVLTGLVEGESSTAGGCTSQGA